MLSLIKTSKMTAPINSNRKSKIMNPIAAQKPKSIRYILVLFGSDSYPRNSIFRWIQAKAVNFFDLCFATDLALTNSSASTHFIVFIGCCSHFPIMEMEYFLEKLNHGIYFLLSCSVLDAQIVQMIRGSRRDESPVSTCHV